VGAVAILPHSVATISGATVTTPSAITATDTLGLSAKTCVEIATAGLAAQMADTVGITRRLARSPPMKEPRIEGAKDHRDRHRENDSYDHPRSKERDNALRIGGDHQR